jgi:hypothetical protein
VLALLFDRRVSAATGNDGMENRAGVVMGQAGRAEKAFVQETTARRGAPEEIRTPDPQIRSLILSNSLTFQSFP